MVLHPPFQIGPRLVPALQIGDVWISLEEVRHFEGREGRDVAKFILDFPDGRVFEDDSLQSGCQGFQGTVTVFKTLLSFLGACGESIRYGQRTGRTVESADLFPSYVGEWASENLDEISCLQCDLCLEDSDEANEELIEE